MPPKKGQQPNKKTEQKKKDKIIEDKTFGLKNKKGSKNQKYIQTVTKQVQYGNQKASRVDELQQNKNKKEEKKKEQEELNKLFKPVTAAQKVAKGVDPKSVLCAFFKQGQCKKGDKCKFSHDITIQRKAEKRSMYEDERDEKEKDTMDNWDDEKLKDVVNQKHGEAETKTPKTDKVCKFFLQAIEDCKYGWFWICPNGGDKCMYKHALPQGFVLKKNKKTEDDDDEEKISLEELIEEERAKLASSNLTKLTLESFTAWKKRKIAEKKRNFEEKMTKKKNDFKQGKALGLSGREVFEFKPELADADDEGADDTKYEREVEDEEEVDTGPVKEITLEAMGSLATEVDNTGTISSGSQREGPVSATMENSLPGASQMEDESSKLGMAGALPSDATQVNGVPIDEGVFAGEDVPVDEDLFTNELDDLDDELDGIDLDD
ncbi:zinc finger CCCH domain-containing protein 15-like [Anneissia japonica]|uniref:zinc finger CCCH domain-containing protein 15-like n=1 Tax=Anneissia japonica TaxID=1529436 RepID=UPI0014254F27|nr:zinc finger CCCH domain-containing protein 15-like [Anneissia japonica]